MTFLDNHDMKERIRYVDPAAPHRYDDQVTLGLACLYSLPGIPCLYYGTEQGLSGRGNDEAVREALWGGPAFDGAAPSIAEIPNLREFGPITRRSVMADFISVQFPRTGSSVRFLRTGILAFSRILNEDEIVVVQHEHRIGDRRRHRRPIPTPDKTSLAIAYSNNPAAQSHHQLSGSTTRR